MLKKLGINVLLVDGAYHRLKEARMAGIEIYYGEILSEHAEHTLESQHLNHLLCATDNDFYNALACKAQAHRFGVHRVFQLATKEASAQELKRLTLQRRGYFAFSPLATFALLHQRLQEGWTISTTRFSASYRWSEFTQRLGERGHDWLLLGGVSPEGMLRLYAAEQPVKLEAGWTVLYFAPAAGPESAKD
ncbi:MAG: NAD-binding protein [Burkholderiaceae bacterium]